MYYVMLHIIYCRKFHSFYLQFLNLMCNCDSLLYSDYFYSFLTSEEHNEAVSHIKLGRYGEAVPLLETIFHIREKLLTASNIMVLLCLCELVACLSAVNRIEEAYAYTQVCIYKIFHRCGIVFQLSILIAF